MPRDRTPAAAAMAALTYVLDSFHQANHTACLDSSHPLYMPEVLRSRHSQLNGVNSQTAEQFLAWMDAFVGFASNMAPYVFRVFTMLLAHWFNVRVAQQAPPKRPRPHRRSGTPTPVPSASSASTAVDAAEPTASSPALAQPAGTDLTLRRNPRGVGFWGGGKFHWQAKATDTRPPCGIAAFARLPEAVTVPASAITWESPIGFVLRWSGCKYELCRNCARMLQRENLLDV